MTEMKEILAGLSMYPYTNTIDPTTPDGETSLDIQWITAMAPGASTNAWHAGFFSAQTNDSSYAECTGRWRDFTDVQALLTWLPDPSGSPPAVAEAL